MGRASAVRRGLTGLAGVAAAAALAAGTPGVANAAATWTIQPVPLPPSTQAGELSGVSCPTSSFCVATDPADAFYEGYDYPAVEMWNGSTWSAQVLPLTAAEDNYGNVSAVSCASAVSCTAVGYYNYYSGPGEELEPMSEEWNGSTWTPETMPAGSAAPPSAVSCVSPASCLAVGKAGGAMHWNGTTWKVVAAPLQPAGSQGIYLRGLSCPSATSCTAVGESLNDQDIAAPLAEHWNGSSWEIEDAQPASDGASSGFEGIACISPSTCFAVGYARNGETALPLAERWSHGSWAAVTMPLPSDGTSGYPEAISCVKATSGASHCVAVGTFIAHSAQGSRTLAEYWNGHQWAPQQTASPDSDKEFLAVSCVAGSTCEAVGAQSLYHGKEQMLAEQN